ncbi:hypothetical protein OCH239_17055 [Roseivivax halodurans JCM 10272]|uniref:Uncharacterized protein n=1 Tax=Roseivivax halodurans JCM 10272 TaxID=1449350 RepID=X7EAC4_9RHOB|nr:hypothetical protein [Roseivivax halodurans]ETX12810.1 hypothetical protein OCH239_17055 [Roseivivax halodurans JCM 10272]
MSLRMLAFTLTVAAPSLAAAQDFQPELFVDRLNEAVDALNSDDSNVAILAGYACEVALQATEISLTDQFFDVMEELGIGVDEVEGTRADDEDFLSFELDAFESFGASEQTMSFLRTHMTNSPEIGQTALAEPSVAASALEEFTSSACEAAARTIPMLNDNENFDPAGDFVFASDQERSKLKTDMQDALREMAEASSTEAAAESGGSETIAESGSSEMTAESSGSGEQSAEASEGSTDAENTEDESVARAAAMGVLGLAVIAVDGAITVKTGGMAAAIFGIASGGWGWNRVEEATSAIRNS